MMKRGVVPHFLHINAGTYGGNAIEACTMQNLSSLSIWSGSFPLRLETISAQHFFDYITSKPDLYRYRCVLCKRFMLQCAQAVAREREAPGIVTGDNLGQVASQTIDNLYTLTAGCDLPIFRPLLTYDKEEIVTLARKIGTFIDAPGDTSCAAVPKKPSIAAPKKTIDQIVQEHALDLFVSAALEQRTMIKFENGRQVD
jgi:thiamine biosynthesis protein ThiI